MICKECADGTHCKDNQCTCQHRTGEDLYIKEKK